MNKSILQSHLNELTSAIQLTLDAKKDRPALILIYSTVDILAWLNRPAAHPDVTRDDFISWVKQYLLPGSSLICSAEDLYAARCGIIHSYQAESKLSREGRAKQIWYTWGKGNVACLMNIIKQTKKNAVAVQLEELFAVLKLGIINFMAVLDANSSHSELVYERTKKFFADITHKPMQGK